MRLAKALTSSFVLAAVVAVAPHAESAGERRSFVAGSYVMYLDNAPVSVVPSISGGGVSANVVAERTGSTGNYPKKRASGVVYEDITFGITGSVINPLAEWMKATTNTAQPMRKSGMFVSTDPSFKELSRTTWTNGIISDITFPELDAASREPARIQLTISPESTHVAIGNAGKQETAATKLKGRQDTMVTNAFRFSMPGMEAAARVVSHIDPLSVRFKIVTSIGEARDYEKTAGQVDVSNLSFVVPESAADALYKWHEDFVVKGNNSDAKEKTASIELLGPDMKKVLYKINLKGVGILKIGPDKSSTEQVRRVRVEAYVESVGLETAEPAI